MTLYPQSIRPIYDMPDHEHYGPTRRMWVMLEQLFADRGGVRWLEFEINRYRGERHLIARAWYDHLSWLLATGLSEAEAQRTVLGQLLVAALYIA